MATDSYAGPVDFAVFAVPGHADVTAALTALLDRVAGGTIDLLDFEILARDTEGHALRHTLEAFDHGEDFDFSVFDGTASDILDDDDLAAIAEELDGDEIAIAVVYEDRSLATVAERVADRGGRVLWTGGIDVDDLAQAVGEADEQDGDTR